MKYEYANMWDTSRTEPQYLRYVIEQNDAKIHHDVYCLCNADIIQSQCNHMFCGTFLFIPDDLTEE